MIDLPGQLLRDCRWCGEVVAMERRRPLCSRRCTQCYELWRFLRRLIRAGASEAALESVWQRLEAVSARS